MLALESFDIGRAGSWKEISWEYITRLTQAMSRESWVTWKRTQHCWPITLNIAGCYMLRPFSHSFACRWVLLWFASTRYGHNNTLTLLAQQRWELLRPFALCFRVVSSYGYLIIGIMSYIKSHNRTCYGSWLYTSLHVVSYCWSELVGAVLMYKGCIRTLVYRRI